MKTEYGRCLRHGYVTERCCRGFEAIPATNFLRPAVDVFVRTNVRVRDITLADKENR